MITIGQVLRGITETLEDIIWIDFSSGDNDWPQTVLGRQLIGGHPGPVAAHIAHYMNEEEMSRQRRRSEMPSEEEVLETKLWTLAKYLRELPVEFRYHSSDGVEYAIKEVIDLSPELHKKVIVVLEQPPYGTQDSAVEKEPSQGDVRSGGHPGQPRAHASSVGPTTTHSGGPEEM